MKDEPVEKQSEKEKIETPKESKSDDEGKKNETKIEVKEEDSASKKEDENSWKVVTKSKAETVKKKVEDKKRSRSKSVKKEKKRSRSKSVKKEKKRSRSKSAKKNRRKSRSKSRGRRRRKRRTRSRSRGRRRRKKSRSRSRDRRKKKKERTPPKPKTEWDELEELARKKKRAKREEPRKKSRREIQKEKEKLDKIQRLMKWKAKQQASKVSVEETQRFKRERREMQDQAEKLRKGRAAQQARDFSESEKKWQKQKEELERRMELKLQKRKQDREKKAQQEKFGGFFKRLSNKNKISFGGFGNKKEPSVKKEETVEVKAEEKPPQKKEKVEEPVPEEPAEEIDPLDAYMNQIAEVQRVDDLKVKQKQNAEVIYNDETVYDEEDLKVEVEVQPIKNWSLKKKELKFVDHGQIEYEPFQKKFYIEAPEIRAMTEEEVVKYQEEELKGVKIHGQNCPKPIKKWTQCGLPEKVMKTLVKSGYETPFPVQCQTIPAIMSGRDLIACAKTGSGKTAAFVLPMLRHILGQRSLESGEGPLGLIIAPTRELSVQIYHETKKFAKPCGLRVAAIYGGAPISEQIAALKRGAEIVVCTPGRMIDILCTNQGRVTNVRRVTYVVLDEADRMFDMGFEPQIMSMLKQCRPDRQTLLFSATFPRVIESLARQILSSPLEIIVGGRSVASEDVTQVVEIVPNDEKFKRVLELLGTWYNRGNILIFHDKQESVDELFTQLQRVGYMALVIHGGVDQFDRENAIMDFKKKIKTVMLATSVMSRGLDVKDLKVVINYSSPHHYEDYVHRVGRTGRAGSKGFAFTLMDPEVEMKYASDILKAMIRAKQEKGIPDQLKDMAKKFKDKVREGSAIAYENRGYKTKGYKFDEEEAKRREESKKRQQGVYMNPDEIPDVVLSELQKSRMKSDIANEKLEQMQDSKKEGNSIQQQIKAMKEAMKKAKEKNATKGQMQRLIKNASRKAQQKAQKFQKKLVRQLAEKIYHEEQTKKYQAEGDKFTARLDLNEYPENIRRKLCGRTTLDQTKAFCGDRVEILRRGAYVQPGKKNEFGIEPLHLLIQSDSKTVVSMCQRELCRILNEAVQAMGGRGALGRQGGGRYKVV